MPARVLLQDFTGVPCVVDLAAMRDAVIALGGNPDRVNPLQPVELVIDHSVQVDYFGRPDAFALNAELEFSRNRERYAFLRWGQRAFNNFKVVPPDTGIVHQVNIEYLARVVVRAGRGRRHVAYPDTLVGTDSHTTMVNGLGVVGWGVGGIEAEAAMLGQPSSMLIPQVLGFRLTGAMPKGADGHRPGAHDHRDAAQARRRRQVRRVLRRGAERADDRRPRDARQHVSRVRRDRGDFPDRRHDARLPAPDRTRRVAGGAGRAVRDGAGTLPHVGQSRRDLLGDDRPRSVVDRAESGRTEASAGSRVARQRQDGVPGGAAVDAGAGQRIRWHGGAPRRRSRRWRCRRAGRRDARSRRGRDCRHHQLHEHLEPERDDRRGARREEGRGTRSDAASRG